MTLYRFYKLRYSVDFENYDAVLFDLDGVLTSTEKVHSACWKEMFDDFLKERSVETGEEFVPFNIESDYLIYVDGKPRYQGVRDFLNSRGIHLPEGTPESPPSEKSIMGLGNKKNKLFNESLDKNEVEVYEGSLALVKQLKDMGIKMGVVSSSQNCKKILTASKMDHFFDVVIDGSIAAELNLRGKPEPDTFLEASSRLNINPEGSVVVEDALSGVKAGKKGKFGLVIGVARKGNFDELKRNGADVVVSDLEELI